MLCELRVRRRAQARQSEEASQEVLTLTLTLALIQDVLKARREGREVAGEEEGRSCSSKAECGRFQGRASRRDGDNEEACGEDNGGVKHGACGEESAERGEG